MVPIWGHQALWDVRQHPTVHAVVSLTDAPAGRVALYEEGRSGFGEYAGIVEPWPPATLMPLGRRLLGLDAWPTAARRP
jgi:hypothetical protein